MFYLFQFYNPHSRNKKHENRNIVYYMFFEITGIILTSSAIGAFFISILNYVVNITEEEEVIRAEAIPVIRAKRHYSDFVVFSRAQQHQLWRHSLGTIHEE